METSNTKEMVYALRVHYNSLLVSYLMMSMSGWVAPG